jgi:hypothetical protein
MMEKSALAGEGGGARPPPFSLLPSRTKLQCTLLLSGQIHSPCFISTSVCSLCSRKIYEYSEQPYPVVYRCGGVARARICKPFKEPRNRFPSWRPGTTTPFDVYRAARLHRLEESISWNRFLGSVNVYKYGLGIDPRDEELIRRN